MADQESKKTEASDEIDLGQLFKLIGNGFRSVFRAFLSLYLYLKSNLFWFLGLIILGALTGYILGGLVEDKQMLEVIVRPNMDETNNLYDTRTYLYDAITEIQSEIKAKDTAFFQRLGVDAQKMRGFEIEIIPLTALDSKIIDSESETLEMLKDFKDSGAISDILKAELRNKTKTDQRISFYFNDPESGREYARKIIEYINSNTFYSELLEIQGRSVQERIRTNDSMIRQVDRLIDTYTHKMARAQSVSEGQLVLENQESLDVPALFELKNELIRDTEYKRMELEMSEQPITVVNFGNAHEVIKPLFRKNLIFFPLLFVGVFLLVSLIRFLNKKAAQLNRA